VSVNWGDFGILPGEALVFKATIAGPALDPGEYLVKFETSFTDVDGLSVRPQGLQSCSVDGIPSNAVASQSLSRRSSSS
jgi:hypothetical protein